MSYIILIKSTHLGITPSDTYPTKADAEKALPDALDRAARIHGQDFVAKAAVFITTLGTQYIVTPVVSYNIKPEPDLPDGPPLSDDGPPFQRATTETSFTSPAPSGDWVLISALGQWQLPVSDAESLAFFDARDGLTTGVPRSPYWNGGVDTRQQPSGPDTSHIIVLDNADRDDNVKQVDAWLKSYRENAAARVDSPA